MSRSTLLLGALALTSLAASCATQADVRTMRQPLSPPDQVILAERGDLLHENVAIYEILGAPEFFLFDDGGPITTRPTRRQVNDWMRDWLSEADMLASSFRDARFQLTVEFENLSGPNVWWFTDKDATSRVRYTLKDRATGAVAFEQSYDSAFRARMPGVTEEMVRAAIVGGVFGAIATSNVNDVGDERGTQRALLGIGTVSGLGGAAFAAAHDTLTYDWPEAMLMAAPRIEDGISNGLHIGLAGAVLAEQDANDTLTNGEASILGGLVGAGAGFVGAAYGGRPAENLDSPEALGAFDGERRRDQAVTGMMAQSFNRFMMGLDGAGMADARDAATCLELNPEDRQGRAIAVLVSTADARAYDCTWGRGRY